MRLVIGLRPLEARQEGVVDIDHLAVKPLGEIVGQDLHVAGKDDEIGATVLDDLQERSSCSFLLSLFTGKT